MREHSCDVAQGYLYAHPESPDDTTQWLKANQRASATYVRSISVKKRADDTGT
jgi:hypothetical protein